MDCGEARDSLGELARNRLPPDLADAVRAHAVICRSCGDALRVEATLHGLIREHAPRYAAPPALRARIQATLRVPGRPVTSGWRAWFAHNPWVTGGLAAAVAALCVVWVWTGWRTDPVSRLVAQAVAEHIEYARDAMPRPAPEPAELLAALRSAAGFPLGPLFPGDWQTQLISTLPAELGGKSAVALIYRNGPERYTTLLVMPGADVTIPPENRLPIDSFKPYHRVSSGKQVLYWKQQDLAYVMVSDLEGEAMTAMFLRIRTAD